MGFRLVFYLSSFRVLSFSLLPSVRKECFGEPLRVAQDKLYQVAAATAPQTLLISFLRHSACLADHKSYSPITAMR